MSMTMTGAVTGGAQTGFTTPGFTLSVDNAPDVRSKQSYISALSGTMVGVVAHSVNAPFTVTERRPSILKTISSALLNGVTGQYSKVPFNEYTRLVRKAAQVANGQWVINEDRRTNKVYAGTETYDSANVRALISFAVGYDTLNSAGRGDTMVTGTL